MKEFKKALSTLPVTKPIFRVSIDNDNIYYRNTVSVMPISDPTFLVEDADSIDLKLAKEHWKERYNSDTRSFELDYNQACESVRYEISYYIQRFLKNHIQAKHPKNTKLYKFSERLKGIMNHEDAAEEAFYSVYKYLWSNSAVDEESTNIHVQNGLKILETLRHRFEKIPK